VCASTNDAGDFQGCNRLLLPTVFLAAEGKQPNNPRQTTESVSDNDPVLKLRIKAAVWKVLFFQYT